MLIDNPSVTSNITRIRVSIINLLANFFPFFIFIIVGLGFSAAFLLNRLDYATRGLIIGIPAIMAAYSLIKMRSKGKLDNNIILLNVKTYFITGLFITLYLFSISSVIISPTRPWYYFILIACLFCIVGVQIFSKNQSKNLILIEIVGLIMNMAYSVVLKYPLYFGFTDTLYLIGISKVTLLSGHVIPPDLEISYANFPLYHIYLTEVAVLLGLDLQTVLYIVMIIPYAILIFFIFKLFYLISNNQQLSLLVCLIYAALSDVIYSGTSIQTRVMAYIGFIILLYLIFKEANSNKSKLSYRILFFLLLAYVILVHQVSILEIIPLLLALFIIEWIINDKRIIRLDILATIFIMTFSYWIYGAFDFFHIVFSRLDFFSSESLLMIKPSVQIGNEWDFIFLNLDTAILVFFVLSGIGYLLYTERKKYIGICALFGMVMLPFFVPNPLQLLWSSMILFRADRMVLLLAPFFAFLMAGGIYVHVNLLEKHNVSKKVCCGIILLIIFSFTLLSMTLTNASDSNDIFWLNSKNYFDQGEISGLSYISNYIPLGSTLTSDYHINRYFGIYRRFSKSDEINFPYYKITNLDYSGDTIAGGGYLIIREKELKNKGLLFASQIPGYSNRLTFNQETQKKMDVMYDSTNRLYDNRNVIITESPRIAR